jgi:hypothetical protein
MVTTAMILYTSSRLYIVTAGDDLLEKVYSRRENSCPLKFGHFLP